MKLLEVVSGSALIKSLLTHIILLIDILFMIVLQIAFSLSFRIVNKRA